MFFTHDSPRGQELAFVLSRFSLDLVSIVAEYARQLLFCRSLPSLLYPSSAFVFFPNRIAVSANNELFLSDCSRVKVWTLDGVFVRELDDVIKPMGLHTNSEGNVLVLDDHLGVLEYKTSKTLHRELPIKFVGPGRICEHNDELFIPSHSAIVAFSKRTGEKLRKYTADNEPAHTRAIAVSPKGELFVANGKPEQRILSVWDINASDKAPRQIRVPRDPQQPNLNEDAQINAMALDAHGD